MRPVSPEAPPDVDVVARQVVRGKKKAGKNAPAEVDLADAITSVHIGDTMTGSSTLRVDLVDPDWKLLDSGFFDANADGKLDKIDVRYPEDSRFWWRLTQLDVSALPKVGMIFMERAAAIMLDKKGPVKASRGKKTRAEFLKSLSDQVKVGGGLKFHCKELHVLQTTGGTTGPVFNVGDSLAVGSAAALKSLLGSRVTTDADEGRSTTAGVDILEGRTLPRTLVIQLGTNDSNVATFTNQVQAVKSLDGVDRIYWVNIARPILGGVTDSALNAVLDAEANEKLRIIDWKGLVQSGGVTLTDGTHPDASGYERRATLIANAVGRSPSEPKKRKKTDKQREEEKSPGINTDEDLTIAKGKASRAQLRQVERSLDVAEDTDAPELAVLSMVCAGIGESGFRAIRNQGNPPSDYHGVFQGHISRFGIDDTEEMAGYFLKGGKGFQGGGAIALANDHPNWGPGLIAVTVEGSRANFPSDAAAEHHYGQWEKEAKALIAAYGGGFGGTVRRKKYHFQIGGPDNPRENFWDGSNRLAEEVNWPYFVDGQHVYYDSEMTLIRQKPVAVIRRNDAAVVDFNGTWDARQIATEMTLTLICNPFEFRAGQVFKLVDFGPFSTGSTANLPGRWLISEIDRDRASLISTFTLRQPEKPIAEPQAELVERSNDNAADVGGDIEKGMTPKEVIDKIVLPIARECGVRVTVLENDAANARHGDVLGGGRSDHQGPPSAAWASDMSNGSAPTKEMDKLAEALIDKFDLPNLGSPNAAGPYVYGVNPDNAVSATHDNFRFQMIYRSGVGGNHFNHVHFGVRAEVQGPYVYGPG